VGFWAIFEQKINLLLNTKEDIKLTDKQLLLVPIDFHNIFPSNYGRQWATVWFTIFSKDRNSYMFGTT